MKRIQHAISFAIASVGLTALVLSAGAVQPLKIDFSDETVGAEPKSFISVVGVWRIETDGNNKVLVSINDGKPAGTVDHFAIGIPRFTNDAARRYLTERGATPLQGDYAGLHIKDPDGVNVQISART